MSNAAQITIERSRTRLSPRSAARLRRYTLRGVALVYLGAMVALPVIAVISKGFSEGLDGLRTALAIPGATAAIRLTLITSTLAALINAVMGTMLAYVLVRFSFPGKRFLSAVVDLPLAIPTLVTGVMLVACTDPRRRSEGSSIGWASR